MSRLDKVLRIQEEIEDAKYNIAKWEGKKESLQKQLKKKYGCKNEVEVKRKIKTLRKTLNEKRSTAERSVTALLRDFKL